MTNASDDPDLLSIIEEKWLSQFGDASSITVSESVHSYSRTREFERDNVDYMLSEFRDAAGPVQGGEWHDKFFRRHDGWCGADMLKWVDEIRHQLVRKKALTSERGVGIFGV